MSREEELSITAGEVVLSGTLTLPDLRSENPDDRWPAALLLPTLLPRDRDGRLDRAGHPGWFTPLAGPEPGILRRLAEALSARGVATLRYDKRGCGRSGGDWSVAGLFTLVDDARDAVAALRGHASVDPARIGLVGHGEGAWLSLSVAAADPGVGPLTLVGAPARGLRDVLRRAAAERRRRRADVAPPDAGPATRGAPAENHPFVIAFDRMLEELIERSERGEAEMTIILPGGEPVRLGLAGWEQAMQIPTRALATLQRRSVSIAHGTTDAWVDPVEADLLMATLAATSAPRRILALGAGHDLAEAPADLFRDLAADLAARLQPRRLPTVLLSIGLR